MLEVFLYPGPSKDVDLTVAELGLVGADGQEGLDRVVREAAVRARVSSAVCRGRSISLPDLRVDAVASLLVRDEEVREDCGRQVLLHARLLSSEK